MKPTKAIIFGIPYTIIYTDKPSDVDVQGRACLSGQIDYWTRTIRLYNKDNPIEDIWQTLLHEVIHAILYELKLPNRDDEEFVDRLCAGLCDTLIRNNWIDMKGGKNE